MRTGASRRSAILEASKKIKQSMGPLDLWKLKTTVAKKYGIAGVIKNSEILVALPKKKRTKEMLELLRIRATRTVSGVSVIAVMTKGDCPGTCIYCPRGEGAAQSYTGKEPASLRAIQNNFDPYLQVGARIRQLQEIGHPVSKCELILMGGTFNAQPKKYQSWFVQRCLDAMNGKKSKSLKDAQAKNENAGVRMVGMTVETRPDWAKARHVEALLELGATRVELGVQTLYDFVYRRVMRGHTVADVAEATQACKDSGLKVCYHMMPGLFADKEMDVAIFKKMFDEPRFRPDMLKIYPCMVFRGTKLYELWKSGQYVPYSAEEAAEVIAEAKRHIPPYVRVMRVQRDIPAYLVDAGVKHSNLRQIVEEKLAQKEIKCRCIRCREIGLKMLKEKIKPDLGAVELKRATYDASGGTEIFLSFEETKHDALIGLARLRIPFKPFRPEIDARTALLRELHVYGGELMVEERARAGAREVQHKGFGERLLAEAERLAREEHGMRKLAVLSGVGARAYYYARGYKRDGVYVSKIIGL
ncbi:MAG: tRNA uridine(34) 5-carboxymethylaminomethyl modification radical SAM/GNAT enzyme Elp3 [Candidatus Micrarchaeota archaeon]